MSMSPADLREWAKEEILDAIDDMIRRDHEHTPGGLDADDISAFVRQRNRVAKLFRLDERTANDIIYRKEVK